MKQILVFCVYLPMLMRITIKNCQHFKWSIVKILIYNENLCKDNEGNPFCHEG